MARPFAAAAASAMVSHVQLCQLALLATLLPCGVSSRRPEGGLDSHSLSVDDLQHDVLEPGPGGAFFERGSLVQMRSEPDIDKWVAPVIRPLADALARAGQKDAAETVMRNPKVVAGVGLFLCFIVVLAVVMMCSYCCRSRPPGGLPPESELGSEEVTLPQKLSKLKKEKMRLIMEQVMQRNKLEKLIEGILKLEAELQQAQGQTISTEEVQKRAGDALKAAEMLTERSLVSALAYVAPLAMQGGRVYEVFENRKKQVQDRVTKLAWDEAQTLCRDMQEVFGIDEDLRTSMFGTLRAVEVPSLATILSNALAPFRLRLLMITVQLCIATDMLYALIAIFVIVTDRERVCGMGIRQCIYKWYSVDLAVTSLCMIIRCWSLVRVSRSMKEIDTPPETSDDPVKAFRLLLDYYMTEGSEALESYEEHMSSYLNYFANVSIFFYLVWMIYATWLVFETPWANCVTAGLIILRIRVCFFLIFLFPLVLGLVSFIVNSYLESESFKLALLSTADSVDQLLQLGVPIMGILVQSFLIRNRHDFTYMNLRKCELKHHDLTSQEQAAKEVLQKVETERAELAQEMERLKKKREEEALLTDNELKAKHIAERDAILKDAESLFTKLAGKAESLSREAEQQVKRWEEAGHVGIADLLDAGMTLNEAQEYMMQAARGAEDRARMLAQDSQVQRALGEFRDQAQRAMQDLPSLDAAIEQSRAQLNVERPMGSAVPKAAPRPSSAGEGPSTS